MLQDDYRKFYKKLNPTWKDSVSIYREIVKNSITRNTVVLEAGCGFSNMFEEEYKRAKRVIGVDVNEEFLKMNECIRERIVSNLESIQDLKDNSVDLIISSWVFEHVQCPAKAFLEFSRVLKEGGKLIFLTPNNLNYVVFLNRLTPESMRNRVIGKMSENLVTDPMPAFYRANSVFKLKKLAKKSGLKVEKLILNGDPTYVAINKTFFYIGVIIEKMLSLPFLNSMKVHIIGVFRK